ncbi:hypothetical protein RCO28_10475 [Streptomyces sp. LHD-70]|uniref:hypothetical protein n=1 Tax=Streptomyces sp. LHD-70 TaxID=3072140 RepID=UPI0028107B69|nr:hypothetical protein [Streptomyces sp. LHD-70]MDQ8702911.1 hypothetical protein [Streptomyces sp. LHD-70]
MHRAGQEAGVREGVGLVEQAAGAFYELRLSSSTAWATARTSSGGVWAPPSW